MSNEQKPRSLFAAYSNNNVQLLESDKQTTTTITTASPSWLSNSSFKEKEKQKKRASDFFNLEDKDDQFDNSKATSPSTSPTTAVSITPITQKSKQIKKRSFVDSDSDNSGSSSSDSSDSSDDEGFTYNRKKFKKQQEKERKKEKREKRKKKRYSRDDKALITNDLFENKTNNEKYYIETIGDKSNLNTTVTAMNKLLPNYDYDNFIVLGLDNCKIGYSKKEGYKIEDIKSTTNTKKHDQNRYFKSIQLPTSRQTFEKVKSIKNITDPTISNDNEIKLKVVADTNDNDDNGENDDEETLERKLLKKNSELNKQVEIEPNNQDAWIRLVKFQENFQQFSNKMKRSNVAIYEKQLAIYRNALLVNPDSELLTIEYLKLASKIWDQQKVLDLWNKLIDKNSSSGTNGISETLWKEYIEFCLSNFNEFTVGKMKDTIVTVIKKMLIKRRSFKVRDTNFMENVQIIEESILQFISQLTRFLIQAGFSERVIGIYQSLIEFNCFEPIQLSNESQATLLKEFKLFWSSVDHPKIGESNSIGWSKSYNKLINDRINSSSGSGGNSNSNGDNSLDNLDNLSIEEIERLLKEQEDEEQQVDNGDIFNIVYKSKEEDNGDEQQVDNQEEEDMVVEQPKSNESKFNEWGKKEIQFDNINWLPLNVNDINLVDKEVNSNDTERVVLFNDFYELLFRFVKEENKVELVFQFLEFLGVPITLDEKLPPRFPFNHPIRRESINSINTNNISLLFQHLKQTPTSTTTTDWISTFDQITTITKLDNDRIKFIDCVFKLILESSNGINIKLKEKLYISYVLFKASMIGLEEAKIYTKSLCEKFKQQVIYFDIFAWLEIKSGKIQEAKKIYQTTCTYINQIKSTITQHQIDFIYREYLVMELCSIHSAIDKDPSILKRFIQSNHKPIELFIIPLHIIQCYLENNTYKQYTTTNNNNVAIEQRCQYLKFKFTNNNNNNNSTTNHSADYILIMLIFELLYNGFNGFLILFNQVDQNFKIHSIQHELITIKSIEMVCKLSPLLSVSTEPLKIKNLIISSLDQYYDHPILLSLFLNWESKNQLVNRVRIYFDTTSNINGNTATTSCIFWLFAIRFEIYKLGSAQRIKSLFEKSIQYNSNCKHNNILWKLYIEFEVNRGRLKIAKSIYYRSIKELPYSKIIWLLPFTNPRLSTIFTNSELSDIIKLINEKGIRLRLSFYH